MSDPTSHHQDSDQPEQRASVSSRAAEQASSDKPAAAGAAEMSSTPQGHEDESIIIRASGLTVRGAEGTVYGPLDLQIPDSTLVFLSGRGGSGRTALALTLSGRMKPTEGTLEVCGLSTLKDIRQAVAIAGVDAIDSLDRDVKVRDVLSEHRAWCHGWLGWAPRADDDYRDELLSDLYGTRSLPELDQYVSQLPALDRILIRIALALHPAHNGTIQLLILDDLEQVRELKDRAVLVSILRNLSDRLPVIVNSVNPPSSDLVPGSMIIELFTDESHISPREAGLSEIHLQDVLSRWTDLHQGKHHAPPRHAQTDPNPHTDPITHANVAERTEQ